MNPRFHELHHLFSGAGSDSAMTTLTQPDAELLGLDKVTGKAIVTHAGTKTEPVDPKRPDGRHKLVPDLVEQEIDAVSPITSPETGAVVGYTVNVGVARKALKEKMGNTPVQGLRELDVQAPRQAS